MDSQKSPDYDWGAILIEHPYDEIQAIREAAVQVWTASNAESPMPVEFDEGFRAGAIYAKANSWIDASLRKPEADENYLTLVRIGANSFQVELAPWRHGEYQGLLHMAVYLKKAEIVAWMPIPKLNFQINGSKN